MKRLHIIEATVFAAGIAIGVACAGDSNAQTTTRAIPDDTAAVARFLGVVRGADPLVCEMAARTADLHGSWSNWGSIGGRALVLDSAASALIDWVGRSHSDATIVPPLSRGIRDADACVRRLAGSLLARVRHASALEALMAGLGDAQAGTREVAALGLGMADATSAEEALKGRLTDQSPAVRRAAAWSLGELEAKSAVSALIDLLANDADARVRQSAAWAIGSIK